MSMNILYLVCEQFVTACGFRKRKQIRVGVDAHIDPKCRPVRCVSAGANHCPAAHDFRKCKPLRVGVDAHIDPKRRPVQFAIIKTKIK